MPSKKKDKDKKREREEVKLTTSDVERVAGKLETFMQDLPEQERNVLGWVLTRAKAAPQGSEALRTAAREERVAAFTELRRPLARDLARAVGFGIGPEAQVDVTVVVGWQFKF